MYKAKLSIHEITWSGFAIKVGEPPSKSKEPYTLELLEKEEITLEFAGKKYTIQVKEITENSVELHTENLSIKSKDYGVSLHPEPYEITLQLNQTEIFYTPTMDAGTKWEIKLLSCNLISPIPNSAKNPNTLPHRDNRIITKPGSRILLPKMNW